MFSEIGSASTIFEDDFLVTKIGDSRFFQRFIWAFSLWHLPVLSPCIFKIQAGCIIMASNWEPKLTIASYDSLILLSIVMILQNIVMFWL